MDNNPVMMTDPLGDCPSCPPGVRANGVGYGALGFIGGLAKSGMDMIEGAYNAVAHPVETIKTVAKIAGNDPMTRIQMGAAMYNMGSEIKSTIKYGDSFDKGYLSGQVVGNTALLFVGGGEVNAGTKALAVAGKEEQVVKTLAKVAETTEAMKSGTVLGKYPDYINLAGELGAKRFNIPTDVWNKMSATEQWAANVKFLDRAILRGDNFILSNAVKDINKVTGAFRKELDYLIDKGYKLNEAGTLLTK